MPESLRDVLEAHTAPPKLAPRAHPNQWAAALQRGEHTGEITTNPIADRPDPEDLDWSQIFAHWNLDPADWEVIDGTIQVNAWEMPTEGGHSIMRQYKAKIRRRTGSLVDVSELQARVNRWRPKRPEPSGASGTFVVAVSDTQIGKGLEPGGSEAIVERWLDALGSTVGVVQDLRRLKRLPDRVVIAFMGDLLESCDGHYPSQAFTTDLTRREQETVVRRMAVETIRTFVPQFEAVDVLAVPGNHGENRRNGHAFTHPSDNADVALIEQAMDVLGGNPAFEHLNWWMPQGTDLSVTLDLSPGVRVGFIHGHQAKGSGGSSTIRLRKWWEQMAFDEQPVGDAQLLLAGHYHHHTHSQWGAKTLVQLPSLDNGSAWWTNQGGGSAPPGLWCGVVDAGPRPLRDVHVVG